MQSVLVAAIVAAAVVYLAWTWGRMLWGKSAGSCGCADCPARSEKSTAVTPNEDSN
ncbi:MAG: hypothetical protein AMXMBFR4_25790 [Candidatus Hydrogenedentota bacterium]